MPLVVYTDASRQAKMEEAILAAESGLARNWSQAARVLGIPRSTLQLWRDNYREFNDAMLGAWKIKNVVSAKAEVPDFPTFRKTCFGHETPAHIVQQLEAVEANDRTLILMPPEHAKTTVWAIEYPVYRICKDPNVRIIIVCKNQDVAKKRLYAIKKRLVDHGWYRGNGWDSPIAAWGPFQPTEQEKGQLPWTQTLIYVHGVDSGEKDATVEVLGVGNQIQGARADLIILDDVADLKNQSSEVTVSNQLEWLGQEVNTRLSEGGKLIIIGTRVHEADIYSTLLNPDTDWSADFAKVVQPAILDEETKRTLWPEVWPYDKLVETRRKRMRERNWQLVYQQNSADMPDAPFTQNLIDSIKDPSYGVGMFNPGLNVVMGVDPAMEGNCAITVVALDRASGMRYIVDCLARSGFTNTELLKSFLVDTAARYGAQRCRIEKNAMQGLLSKDFDLRTRLMAHGCQIEEEHTGGYNKYDRDWGVLSVAAAFDQGLYRMPWAHGAAARMQPLIEELLMWRAVPQHKARRKQDRVMSLWLAELSARQFGAYRPGLPTQRPVPAWVHKAPIPKWVRSGHHQARAG